MSEGGKRLILPQLSLIETLQPNSSQHISIHPGNLTCILLSSTCPWRPGSTGLSAPLPSPPHPHQVVQQITWTKCDIRFVELVLVHQQLHIHCVSTSLCYIQTKRAALSYNSNSTLHHQALYNHRSWNVISQSNSDFQAPHKTKTVLRKLKSQVRWYRAVGASSKMLLAVLSSWSNLQNLKLTTGVKFLL